MNHLSRGSLGLTLIATMLVLLSCGASPAASQALAARVGPYALEVLVDGVPVRTFTHAGETHILGGAGSRYVLRVHNHSGRRIEAVVSVDGRDVMDGEPADFVSKRGYLVPAHDHVDIEGWRLSEREAAAFRFAPIADSYAAKTGGARDVGVIGVAVFPERIAVSRRPRAAAAPYAYPAPRTQEASAPREAKGSGASMGEAPAPAEPTSVSAEGAPAADEAVSSAPAHVQPRKRSGLGTEFGEAMSSEIRQVSFVRHAAARPAALLGARYDDRAGLLALGIDVDGCDAASDLALRRSALPFPGPRGFARPPADWRRD